MVQDLIREIDEAREKLTEHELLSVCNLVRAANHNLAARNQAGTSLWRQIVWI